jgi:uncharacterized iron-regulated protein
MIKKITLSLFIALCTLVSFAQDKPAYVIYTAKGTKTDFGKMLKQLNIADIILFGELHNNPIAHWLQLELTKAIATNKSITLGAEMLESDNQNVLNDYLIDKITLKEFKTLARLWPNYATDYGPLVDFAKENKLPFIATNIPRVYANLVYKKDFKALDTLSQTEKNWIAPLPIVFDPELPTYKNILQMMGGHGSELLVKAQAIKDATMAHFILQNYKPNNTFIHFNGAYHSDDYEGILWYLKQANKSLNYKTISTVSQKDIQNLDKEYLNKADFIICVDENMTTTY